MAHQRLSSIKSTQYPLNIRIGMSSGAACRIHMSDATRQALIQPFTYEHCGVIQVKDKGAMSTWFLNNRALSCFITSQAARESPVRDPSLIFC
jgi:hypothetical protein